MALSLRETLLARAVINASTASKDSKAARPLSEMQRRRQRASEAWKALSPQAQATWEKFASKLRRYSPEKKKIVGPSARLAYIRFALQRWHLDEAVDAPVEAPIKPFSGDEIGILAIQSTKSQPIPEGKLRFIATGANRSRVMTELLVQKLPSPTRNPNARKFKAVEFLTFIAEGEVRDISVQPGYYATAYRFVDMTTLQVSEQVESGVVAVGIKPRRKKRVHTRDTQDIRTVGSLQIAATAVIDAGRFATLQPLA